VVDKRQAKQHVHWFRQSSPYINAHRGRTFVTLFGGEAVADEGFAHLVHDIALLNSLGIRQVLVHGARPQIEQRITARHGASDYLNGLRVTDDLALAAVKEAVGTVRVEIEALLSTGLANSPMAGACIRVASGNFVTARPLGVRDGVDFCHTGEVRKVDAQAIARHLDAGEIVLLSPIGYSPTGEAFNLSAEDVATAAAVALRADKLVALVEGSGLTDARKRLIPQLNPAEAEQVLQARRRLPEDVTKQLLAAVHACRNGVPRAHLVSRQTDGALLLELFTREGIGTMVTAESVEVMRSAGIDDAGGILELIEPLEREGILVRRSREQLELEIGHFTVAERDGLIVGCSALYPYPKEGLAELACLAVHQDYRKAGRGDELLQAMERRVQDMGLSRLFVLTTQTAHWFQERGFEPARLDDLPIQRQDLYNYQRNSKIFVKRVVRANNFRI
jgi:amino-acid N-acetyltransferase